MKKTLFLSLILCLIAGTALAAGTIKIGLMCPLTGPWASEGQDMKDIVTLLADEVNDAGGLIGKKLEIITADDGGDARNASLAAQRLSTQGIIAVIGTYGSAVTEATQGIYNESEIIQIANGSTSVRLTEKGLNYFFRTCPRDDEQGYVGFNTIQSMNFKRIAILHDNSSYAKGLADETLAHLKKAGANIVFYDALTPKENDYTAILTKMKAADPDCVYFTGYYSEVGMLLRQKKEMGWNVTFIGGDATNNPDLVKIAGTDAAEGYYFLSPPVPQDLPTPEAKSFMTNFKKRYDKEPGSIWAVLAGDGFKAIAGAIRATGSTDASKLAAYLHKELKDLPGLTGKISFNEKGDRVGDVYRVYKIDGTGNFILQP
ncbi:MAG: branched-chain amino acid ABC transporter substrate-binding protein [Desulfobacterales bacterium]|nr:branched-chain amino acid ABC transporter substrate-binding protein [Desulfobacterales bacterium]MDD4392366.1 branched-chain amino acid ABC transporter substrate-binding protein [Desulfobacterales bacterium]